MADQTTSSIVIAADPATIMAVIRDFDSYPVWAQGVKRAEPVESGGTTADDRPRQVYFELDASPIKDAYTLGYDWQGDEAVTWTLVEGKMLKAMDGAYELSAQGEDRTEVTYRLKVDIAIPMIGMLKRKAEKVIIDTALKGLKKRVESLDRP